MYNTYDIIYCLSLTFLGIFVTGRCIPTVEKTYTGTLGNVGIKGWYRDQDWGDQ